MNSAERKILFVTCTFHFLTHFYILIFPALIMPITRDLNLPLAKVVDISFWMYLLYGILATGWGWISDHWGHKWAMSSGIILAGIGLILAGFFRSLYLISLCFALVGIGCSAYHPSGIALVSQGIRQRGRALGINGIWGNIGIAIVPFAAGVLNLLIGWKKGLVVLGVVGIIMGTIGLFTRFSVEKGKDNKAVDKLEKSTAGKLFFIFCIGMIFCGFMYRSFTIILPAFFEYNLGDLAGGFRAFIVERFSSVENAPAFNTLIANLIATCVYFLGIIGQLIGGRVADRFSLKWSYFICFLLTAPFLLIMMSSNGAWLILSSGFFVIFFLGIQPIENSLIAYLTPSRWRSVSYGVKFTLIFGAGSFAVKFVSLIEKNSGINNILLLIAGFLILVILNMSVFLFVSRGHDIRH